VDRECLRIGLQAANGTNLQTWRWLIVTDRGLRADIAALYRKAYLDKVGGQLIAGLMPAGAPETRIMSSTEWLVEHLGEHSYVHLDQPGGDTLIAKVAGGASVEIGARASFRANAATCHLFTEDGFAVPAPGAAAVAHYA